MLKRILQIFIFAFISFNGWSQLDDIHYLPPLVVDENLKNSTGNCQDHFIVLTTPEINSFKVFLQDGNSNPITNYTVINGTGNAITGFDLSKTNPLKIRLSTVANASHNSHGIISRIELNAINTQDVIIAKGSKPFFCNIRHISGAQGGSLAAKGRNALGTSFRVGFANHVQDPGKNYLNNFISVMATQNNTEVVFTNFKNNVTFFGDPAVAGDSIKVVLDAGESYAIGQEIENLPAVADLNDYNGIEVYSNKPIAMNNGSWLSGGSGGARDIGWDQNVPVSKAGNEFVLIQGNGATTIESATVVATNFFTNVFLNGSAIPATTLIFPGDYYVVPGTNYTADQNILVETDQPVLVYQKMFGSTSIATNSMNLIPPLNECSGAGEVILHDTRFFGSGELFMTTRLGSTVEVYENGVITGTYNPVATNITGASGANWRTIKHIVTTPNPVDVWVESDNIINVGFFGASGAVGAAGYFSGFETPPVILGDSSLCDVDSMYLYVRDTFGLASFNWYRNGVLVDSGGDDSLLITDFGFYTVEANYRNCIGTSELSYPYSADQSLCSAPGGVVADLVWLKADDGPLNTLLQIPQQNDQISIWFDRSNFSNDFLENDIGLTVTGPFFEDNFMNFNPSVGFFGNSGMKIDSSLLQHKDTAGTIFAVVKMNTNQGIIFSDQDEDSTSGVSLKGNGATEIDNNSYLTPTGTLNTSQIYTVRRDSAIGGFVDVDNFLNADLISSANVPITSEPTFFSTLGYKYKDNLPAGVGSMMNGYVSEVMLFSSRLTNLELRQVQSYLAIKWGITLNGDYLSSYGSVVWDSTRNHPYIHDIAGISKDFDAALRQKQSKSENLDDILAVGFDTVLRSNNENQGVFPVDSVYFIWGNNDSAIDITTLDLPLTVNSKRRLKREWKVQETNPSAIDRFVKLDLWFDLSILGTSTFAGAGNYYLLIDEDGDGDFNTGNIREELFSSRRGDTVYFNNIDIDDFEVFTLGASIISPGCIVDDLTLWMRSDFGIDTVNGNANSWQSITGAVTIDTIDAIKPTYFDNTSNVFNFNPYVDFSGGLSRLSDSVYDLIFDTNVTVFVVRIPGAAGETTFAYNNSLNQVYNAAHTAGVSSRNDQINYGTSVIPQIIGYSTSATTFNVIEDGTVTLDPLVIPYVFLDSIGELVIGGNSIGGDFSGQVAELIFYDRTLNNTEIQKVTSYLGLKYGITLDHNYRSSIDKKVWDLEINKHYNDQVLALVNDNGYDLKKEKVYNWNENCTFSTTFESDSIHYLMIGYSNELDEYFVSNSSTSKDLTIDFANDIVSSITIINKNDNTEKQLFVKNNVISVKINQNEKLYMKFNRKNIITSIHD